MRRNYGVASGPLKEGMRHRYDQAVDLGVAAVVCFFVDGMAVEIENPGFDVAFWDQVDDSFLRSTARESFGGEALFELSSALSDISSIRVDRRNERRLGSCRACAIGFDCWGIPRTHPSFPASLSTS